MEKYLVKFSQLFSNTHFLILLTFSRPTLSKYKID